MATNSIESTEKIGGKYKVYKAPRIIHRYGEGGIKTKTIENSPRRRIFRNTLSKYLGIVCCFRNRDLPSMFRRQEWSKTDHFKQSKFTFRHT